MDVSTDVGTERAVNQSVTLQGALAREGRADDEGFKVNVVRALHSGGRPGQVGPYQHFNFLWSHAGNGGRTGEARDYR